MYNYRFSLAEFEKMLPFIVESGIGLEIGVYCKLEDVGLFGAIMERSRIWDTRADTNQESNPGS